MTLSEGTRLGAFEITGRLGAGGMGEVYRAKDTELGRDIAIKTLSAALAGDSDRIARFRREAETLAALNHPNIAQIYGLERINDGDANEPGSLSLIMELVDGETLEEKLKQGPLPVDVALRYALQIAEALEAAHDKGVVHRDLKPANVMIRPDGVVKVLDFGLAKAFSGDPNEASPAHSPALSLAMTQQGLILGTAGYMSPEQASGQATDQRADIWAFGVVVYEMLTGLPLFSGESVPHILADVLRADPDWNRLPKNLHRRLKLMLERCLEKKARSRYHSIADARIDIESVLNDPAGIDQPAAAIARDASASSFVGRTALGAAGMIIGAAVVGAAAWLWPEPERAVTRFSIAIDGDLDSTGAGAAIAIAPNGERIVYAAGGQLYSRLMDQDQATAIQGTEDASSPFFSPDGDQIGFFTPSQLKTVGVGGQIPRVIADVMPGGLTGTWDERDRIFFGQQGSFDLLQVPAVGGVPEPVTEVTSNYADVDFPDMLPGGMWLLFSALGQETGWSTGDVVAQNVETGERRLILENGHFARYLPTGHVVFMRNGTLHAIAFDHDRVETIGAAVPVVQGVSANENGGGAMFAVADNGTLVYAPGAAGGAAQEAAIVEASLDGDVIALSTELRNYESPRASPDGTRVAVEVADDDGRVHVWVMDLETGTATQLTFEGTRNRFPVWTRDSQDLLYASTVDDTTVIYRKAADGSDERRHVLDGTSQLAPMDVLPGNVLVYQDVGDAGRRDIMTLELDGNAEPAVFLGTPSDERSARASPDGNWIVYLTDEPGENRVYARPYPPRAGGQRALSEELSAGPVWSADGSEVYFLVQSGMLRALPVTASAATITPGRPRDLFLLTGRFRTAAFLDTAPYDVAPGGGLIAARSSTATALDDLETIEQQPELRVVLNWFEELERLVPVD